MRTPARRRLAGAALLAVALPVAVLATLGSRGSIPAPAVRPATPVRFALRWGSLTSEHSIASTTAIPGETVSFAAVSPGGSLLESAVDGPAGLEPDGAGGWRFTPPRAPGVSTLTVRVAGAEAPTLFRVFSAVPRERVRRGRLNGFILGDYPPAAEVRGAHVEPPRGFIEVTPENARTEVSPHFTLGQFLCKQAGGFPKYLVLDDRLPLKLEALLARVRAEGIQASTLTVMSGFRTPLYNRGLGNVPYSRHLWGAAADVYVDEAPQDGEMDDLDGDGRVDRSDAELLARLADSLDVSPEGEHLVGGLGSYSANHAHGPFVHVDVRDRRARW